MNHEKSDVEQDRVDRVLMDVVFRGHFEGRRGCDCDPTFLEGHKREKVLTEYYKLGHKAGVDDAKDAPYWNHL